MVALPLSAYDAANSTRPIRAFRLVVRYGLAFTDFRTVYESTIYFMDGSLGSSAIPVPLARRISWAAIIAGLAAALGIELLLSLLGSGTGSYMISVARLKVPTRNG